MNKRPAAQAPEQGGDQADRHLAETLARLSDRVAAGESVDIDREAERLGSLGNELRQLWGAVMLAHAAGNDTPTTSPTNASSETKSAQSTGMTLPCHMGDYLLLEEIGRGGMGIVYRAEQQSLGRTVAVKLLIRGPLASPQDEIRFRAEAAAAGSLDHPHIVPVYEVGEHDGRAFFSMKLVPGQTLAACLLQGPIAPRKAASILLQVARGVAFAHRAGLLHRDLKPSNILIDPQGQAHVTDFGLAKQLADPVSLTRSGTVLGTPAYMAPEQAAGNRGTVGPASDVYSLGSILYHMLTGQPPFQGSSPMDVLLQVLEQDPPPPRQVYARVDRSLEMIALRCLQKPVDLRYESADDLAHDLQAYLSDEPLSAQSGRFSQIIGRLFRETHHAAILENWGVLWMWHSLALLIVCLATNGLFRLGDTNRAHYFTLWTVGLGTWAAVFWALRRRRGPVTFVERQIAHAWAASMIGSAMLFPVESMLGLPVLTLSPVLALLAGAVFLTKAGTLSGAFYGQAVILFATAVPMSLWPQWAHVIFGVISALCFFVPGLKYERQRRADRTGAAIPPEKSWKSIA